MTNLEKIKLSLETAKLQMVICKENLEATQRWIEFAEKLVAEDDEKEGSS